jgi:hypothetical protein
LVIYARSSSFRSFPKLAMYRVLTLAPREPYCAHEDKALLGDCNSQYYCHAAEHYSAWRRRAFSRSCETVETSKYGTSTQCG